MEDHDDGIRRLSIGRQVDPQRDFPIWTVDFSSDHSANRFDRWRYRLVSTVGFGAQFFSRDAAEGGDIQRRSFFHEGDGFGMEAWVVHFVVPRICITKVMR